MQVLYVDFTRRHLHHRVDEHKNLSSSFGKTFLRETSFGSKGS